MIAALGRLLDRLERGLGCSWSPWFFGLATVAVVGWLLGSLNPEPWVYDEAAYLLQAKIFATLHWSVPGPVLPEFFEQVHVFVTPRLIPKYPPGHAILLVPGIWLGLAALMPLLMSGATGALVFGLSRSISTGWVGLLTWMIWVTSPEELYLRPSYLSQTSTTLIWLLSWWWIERWRRGLGDRWLIAAAALMGFGLVTRPITAIALGLPVVAAVLIEATRRGRWQAVALAAVVAVPVVAIAPLWSYRTSGKIFPTPYSEYSRVYVPWNMPGFTIDSTAPQRAEIPAIRKFRTEWLPLHQAHTVARLPRIALDRLGGIGTTFFGDGGVPGRRWPPLRWILLVGFAIGLTRLPRAMWPAALGAPILFSAMLWLASRPLWTVYYLEVFPVVAFVTAVGCWTVASRSASARGLVAAGLLIAVPGTVVRLVRAKQQQEDARFVRHELAVAIETIPGRAIVFVEPGPEHRPYESYVDNEPDPATSRVWLAHDRGDDNRRLLALAPDRVPYLFDPGSGVLRPLADR